MSTETAYSIELDREGNMLIAGFTYSNDFPTTSGAIKPTKGGSNKDGFFTKLNADGTSLLYSTFVGGDDDDHLQSVCIDGSGNIFLAGLSSSNDFPTTPDAYDRELDGGSDIIAMKLDPSAANVLSMGGGTPSSERWGPSR
jgi:hypothetical protein